MSLSWWNLNAARNDFVDIEAPKISAVEQREYNNNINSSSRSSSSSSTDPLPGSPSIMFLKAPVVVARMPGEKTGLLPTQRQRPRQRPESRASKQIKRCQLVAVVVMSIVAAAVIVFFWAGDSRRDNTRR